MSILKPRNEGNSYISINIFIELFFKSVYLCIHVNTIRYHKKAKLQTFVAHTCMNNIVRIQTALNKS